MATADIFKLHSKRIYGPDIIAAIAIVYVPKYTRAISHHRLGNGCRDEQNEPSASRQHRNHDDGVSESKSSLYFPQFHNDVAVHSFSLLFSGLMQSIISVRADFFSFHPFSDSNSFSFRSVFCARKNSLITTTPNQGKSGANERKMYVVFMLIKKDERISRHDGDRVDDAHTHTHGKRYASFCNSESFWFLVDKYDHDRGVCECVSVVFATAQLNSNYRLLSQFAFFAFQPFAWWFFFSFSWPTFSRFFFVFTFYCVSPFGVRGAVDVVAKMSARTEYSE